MLEENFREEGDVLFPETTREFLEYLREEIPEDMSVDMAISDEDVRKIELHSDLVNVARNGRGGGNKYVYLTEEGRKKARKCWMKSV